MWSDVGRLHSPAVGQERTTVVEPDHSVAQEQPPLLRVGGDDNRGERVR